MTGPATVPPNGTEFPVIGACDVCGGPIRVPERGRGSAGQARARRCSAACRREHARRRVAARRAPGAAARLRSRAARLRAEADFLEAEAMNLEIDLG